MDKYQLRNFRRRYRNAGLELEQLARERNRLYAIAERCTRSPSMAPGYGGSSDPYPDIFDRMGELEAKAEQRLAEMCDVRMKVERAIEPLPGRERRLMRAYYIEGMTWEQVAEMLGYMDVRHVYRLHASALKKIS